MSTLFRCAAFARPLGASMRAQVPFKSSRRAASGSPSPDPEAGIPLVKLMVIPVGLIAAWYGYTNYIQPAQEKPKLKLQTVQPIPALDGMSFKPFVLQSILPVNHNTKKFRFALPEGTTELGLPTASAVVTKFEDGKKPDGSPKNVIRPYTPIEDPADLPLGHFDLLVKKYPNGPMSTHIHNLKPGDTLEIKGPIPKYPYKANEHQRVGLIAGGTGITPMMQIMQRILSNPEDKTKMSLVFANVTEDDILLKEYFDELVSKHGDRVEVHYVLEKPPKGWKGGVGYVSEKVVQERLPKPGQGKTFICGPNPMLEAVSGGKTKDYKQGEVGGILKKLGYTEDDIYKF